MYFCSEIHVGKVGVMLLIQFPLFYLQYFDSDANVPNNKSPHKLSLHQTTREA